MISCNLHWCYGFAQAILCLPTKEAVERDRKEAEEDEDLEWVGTFYLSIFLGLLLIT